MRYSLRLSFLLACASIVLLALVPRVGLAASVSVTIQDNFFSPQSLSIAPGDTVTWTNKGIFTHSASADGGAFGSGAIGAGQSYTITFNNPGVYQYHDEFYKNEMKGTINVGVTPTTPNTSSGGSIAALQAQIQSLLAQIQALQGSLGGGSTGYNYNVTTSSSPTVSTYAASCPQISRTLQSGDSGDDVVRLQQFLAADPSVYPEAQTTGYFGSLTQAAVQRWQAKYNIVSSGTPESTGYGVVGPRTASAIAIVCAGGTYNGISGYGGTTGGTGGGSASPVGGYINVTPISGNAPLTVNVTATVNTTNSCTGATYVLNFGDNTPVQQIPVPVNNCGQLQLTYQHTYQYGGTYQVTLSSGGHLTSALVAVSGQQPPLTTPTGVTAPKDPKGTLTVLTTSGSKPFTANFYVSCVNAVAFNLSFGDGQDLGGENVGKTNCDGSLQSVTHTYTANGTYAVQLVLFVTKSDGTVASQNFGGATITVGTGASSPTDDYSYSPPSLQNDSSNPLKFTLKFDLPTSCTAYDVSWGDGSLHLKQSDGGTACAQSPVIDTFSHTYASQGSYTITVKRGSSLGRSDDVSVTITQ